MTKVVSIRRIRHKYIWSFFVLLVKKGSLMITTNCNMYNNFRHSFYHACMAFCFSLSWSLKWPRNNASQYLTSQLAHRACTVAVRYRRVVRKELICSYHFNMVVYAKYKGTENHTVYSPFPIALSPFLFINLPAKNCLGSKNSSALHKSNRANPNCHCRARK